MKRIVFSLIVLMMGAANMMAQTVDDLFKEYKDKDHVECINIPKAMMSMASGFVKNEDGGQLVKKIDHIRILNIEDDTALCKSFAEKAMSLSKKGYETMVNSSEDNEKTLILVKTKGEAITEMVILNIEPAECNLIQMKGKFKSSDVEKMVN